MSDDLNADAEGTSETTVTNQPRSVMRVPQKPKIGSHTSTKSSPYNSISKRANPGKILGDFHLAKLNEAFENF